MKETQLCVVPEGTSWCSQPLVTVAPVPLCAVHRMQIVVSALPDILTALAETTRSLALSGEGMVEQAVVVVLPERLPARHAPVVYFLRNGGMIKIGYSRNLSGRMQALSLRRENLLLALAGDVVLERAVHQRFKGLRSSGTEWFTAASDLTDYVRNRQRHALKVPLEDRDQPGRGFRLSTEAADLEFEQRLIDLHTAGGVINFDAVRDLPVRVGRSRGWAYQQLATRAARGQLVRVDAHTYVLNAESSN